MLLAILQGPMATWTIAEFCIAAVLVGAAIAIAYAALKFFGTTVPPVIVYIFWIVVVAVIAIVAIKIVASL
jgi:hypothetical protein